MSLLVGNICKNKIIMASDSRMSTERNGFCYALTDNFQKLYILDDNNILFGCGSAWVIDNMAKKVKQDNVRDIIDIRDIANYFASEHRRADGKPGTHGYVQIAYAQVINGEKYIHLTSDDFGWGIVTQLGVDEPIPFFAGYGSAIASSEYYRDEQKSKLDFIGTVKKSFNLAACESIGGVLTIAEMTSNGITKKRYQIDDSDKKIRWLDDAGVRRFSDSLDIHTGALGGSVQLGGTTITEAQLRSFNALFSNEHYG